MFIQALTLVIALYCMALALMAQRRNDPLLAVTAWILWPLKKEV